MEGIWGSGGYASRKILRGHALQTLGKRGKCPFCFIIDHLADHLYFIPPEIPLAFCAKGNGLSFGKVRDHEMFIMSTN